MQTINVKVCTGRSCTERQSNYIKTRLDADREFYGYTDDEVVIETCMCQGRCKEGATVVFGADVQIWQNPVKASELLRKKVTEARKRMSQSRVLGTKTNPIIIMPKVGYVAIVGRPNAGKSTLVNALIGERVSAISYRPQTTQRTIPGIFTDIEKGIQIIFLDTPGIHHDASEQFGSQKSNEIHTLINAQAFAGLRDADIILRLIDPTRVQGAEDERIDTALSHMTTPILRIETKQDLEKGYLGKNIDYKIDSTSGTGFAELIDAIATKLPEGPYLYEEDQYTDQTMDLRISEVIREQLFAGLGEEIPYACYVEIGSIENGLEAPMIRGVGGLDGDMLPSDFGEFVPKNKKGKLPMLSIQAYINTETDSQKTIIIGKGGKKIQDIGTASRIVLEEIFGKKVFLALRVKVDKNWRKNQKTLERLFPKK